MSALVSPYRLGHAPLATRERAIEEELVRIREMLDAFANEEARVARKVWLRESKPEELDRVRETIAVLVCTEERLSEELVKVREELVARGERRKVNPRSEYDARTIVSMAGLFVTLLALLAVGVLGHLRAIDTAHDAPRGTSIDWGGPVEPDQSWLYVEGPPGAAFEVDGRPFHAPDRVRISALHSHDVTLATGAKMHVRSIPCTTAVVRYADDGREASVERFYNSSTCF